MTIAAAEIQFCTLVDVYSAGASQRIVSYCEQLRQNSVRSARPKFYKTWRSDSDTSIMTTDIIELTTRDIQNKIRDYAQVFMRVSAVLKFDTALKCAPENT